MVKCECGCGRPAPIAKRTSTRDGWIKGQPLRFITGHNGRNPAYGEIRPGMRFGRWTAQAAMNSRSVQCVCDCGRVGVVHRANLFAGTSQSCGCFRAELTKARTTQHGQASARGATKLYRTWAAMIARCENPANGKWERYGGRGIQVCQRWRSSFKAFAADMGDPPTATHSIDRIDNDGHYEPGNCRWALPVVQRLNRPDVKLSEDGAREIVRQRRSGMSKPDIAIAHGVSIATVKAVLSGRNWGWATGMQDRSTQHA